MKVLPGRPRCCLSFRGKLGRQYPPDLLHRSIPAMQDRSSEAAATPSAKGAMISTAKNVVIEKILRDCISTLS